MWQSHCCGNPIRCWYLLELCGYWHCAASLKGQCCYNALLCCKDEIALSGKPVTLDAADHGIMHVPPSIQIRSRQSHMYGPLMIITPFTILHPPVEQHDLQTRSSFYLSMHCCAWVSAAYYAALPERRTSKPCCRRFCLADAPFKITSNVDCSVLTHSFVH